MARNYNDFIGEYCAMFAPKGEAPERFHYWTAVHTIAGALRRRVYLDAGAFRWFTNSYILLVGPPGIVKKSTVINIGSRMLRTLAERDTSTINIGADCTTWQSFVQEIANAKDMFAEGNITETDLLNQTYTVTSALSLQISELGTLLDPRDKAMVEILTEVWDCKLNQEWLKKTKTQGEDQIMNPFVNVIAGTTPGWMNDNWRAHLAGWGLSSRFVFIHADHPDRRIALPHKLWGDSFEPTLLKFVDDLEHISHLAGCCTLDHEAEWFFENWYEQHGRRHEAMEAHPHKDPWLSNYLARKCDHAMKLSLVLSASRRDNLLVTLEDMQEAVGRCDQIEEEISKIFRTKDILDARDKRRWDAWNGICSEMILAGGELEEWKVHNYLRVYNSAGDAKQIVEQMMLAHALERHQHEGETYFSFGEGATIDEAALQATVGEERLREFLKETGARMGVPEPLPPPQSADPLEDYRLVPRYDPEPPKYQALSSETPPLHGPFLDCQDEFAPPALSPEEDPEV